MQRLLIGVGTLLVGVAIALGLNARSTSAHADDIRADMIRLTSETARARAKLAPTGQSSTKARGQDAGITAATHGVDTTVNNLNASTVDRRRAESRLIDAVNSAVANSGAAARQAITTASATLTTDADSVDNALRELDVAIARLRKAAR